MLDPSCLPCNKVNQGVRQLCLLMALVVPALQEAGEGTLHAYLLTADLMLILQDVVEEVTQRMLELEKGWEQVRAHPTKRHICFCCSVQ